MRIIFKIIFVISLLVASSSPVRAQNDIPSPEKIAAIQKIAEAGNPSAQYMVGLMLMMGKGVQTNPEKGLEWMTKAAEQGYEQAQFILGLAYGTDLIGIPADPEKARYWLEKAALQGNKKAATALETLKNAPPPESFEELTKKAVGGDRDAQYRLGGRYMNGWGIEKNPAEGLKWLQSAAEKGNALAQSDLALHLINQGQPQKGVEWMTKAAEQGVVHSQYELGTLYRKGDIVSPDKEKAAFWLEKAAAHGDKRAIEDLGTLKK